MRSRSEEPTGYPDAELRQWADRIREWSRGGAPADLPCLDATAPAPAAKAGRDVFVFFISAAKERNPAAAMALLGLPGLR